MKTFTIHSRKLNRVLTFNANLDDEKPHESKYVRLEEPSKTGTLAPQICHGGGFMGHTVSATPATFERTCRKWYRQHLGEGSV